MAEDRTAAHLTCVTNELAPGLIRNGTPEQYEAAAQLEQERRAALVRKAVADAEPLVQQVESMLTQGFPLARLRSETGLPRAGVENLLGRKAPRIGSFAMESVWSLDGMAATVERLREWLDERAGVEDETAKYAETPTLQAIASQCLEAADDKRITVIVGGFGIGKTFAANAAVSQQPRRHDGPGLLRYEMSIEDKTVARLLERLYARLINREARPLAGAGIDEVSKLLRRGDVVIIDECQRLADCARGAGIEVIRELYDGTAASFVLLGNEALTKRGGVLDEKLYGAFGSRARVFPWQFLYPAEEDIDAFMVWRGVSGTHLRNLLVKRFARAGKRPPLMRGGLRKLSQLLADVATENGGHPATFETVLAHLQRMDEL